MRRLPLAVALIVAAPAAPALAQDVPECTTTTTTTTTCKGSAAPLAAPAPEQPEQPQYPYPQALPPPAAYYPPPILPPMTMRTVERPRTGLIVAGTVIFAATYLLNVSAAYLGGDGTGTLAIPIVGPAVYAGTHQSCCANDDNRALNFWMAVDTLVQAAGLTMAILGAVVKTKVRVFDRVAFAPAVTSGGGGLALAGRF
jgi:hypothetical protein